MYQEIEEICVQELFMSSNIFELNEKLRSYLPNVKTTYGTGSVLEDHLQTESFLEDHLWY